MKRERIYLSPPHLGPREKALLVDAIDSNWIAPLGPHVDAFEREMCAYLGVRSACALSSGTAALHLALTMLGVKRGDIVFCSSLTFVASANPILYLGATPVFIDSDPETGNMSAPALERALADYVKLGQKPKAVIVVDLYGSTANYDQLSPLCARFDVPIVEDATEALGADLHGKKCGTFGAMALLSFNGNKMLSTSGGGMLVSNDPAYIEKARFLSQQARDPAPHYEHSEIGFNYRLSNLLAAVGRGQLEWVGERIERKRALFRRYQELKSLPGVSFFSDPGVGVSSRWLTVMTLDPARAKSSPAALRETFDTHNIESRPAWKPMHRQPLYAERAYYPHAENLSVSDRIFEGGLCLPSGSSLRDDDQQVILDILRRGLA